jgi:hypothetical protein
MYPDYIDASTSRMLEPAGDAVVYDVHVAPGRNPTLPLPPGDGRWIAVSALEPQVSPEPEPPADAVPEGEPETPAEVSPDGAESPPEATEGEPAPEGAPEPENPAEEATDHSEGVE